MGKRSKAKKTETETETDQEDQAIQKDKGKGKEKEIEMEEKVIDMEKLKSLNANKTSEQEHECHYIDPKIFIMGLKAEAENPELIDENLMEKFRCETDGCDEPSFYYLDGEFICYDHSQERINSDIKLKNKMEELMFNEGMLNVCGTYKTMEEKVIEAYSNRCPVPVATMAIVPELAEKYGLKTK